MKAKMKDKVAAKGFGDNCWRINYRCGGAIELSFGNSPDVKTRRTIKGFGFRWSPSTGVWYLVDDKLNMEVGKYIKNTLKMREAEHLL